MYDHFFTSLRRQGLLITPTKHELDLSTTLTGLELPGNTSEVSRRRTTARLNSYLSHLCNHFVAFPDIDNIIAHDRQVYTLYRRHPMIPNRILVGTPIINDGLLYPDADSDSLLTHTVWGLFLSQVVARDEFRRVRTALAPRYESAVPFTGPYPSDDSNRPLLPDATSRPSIEFDSPFGPLKRFAVRFPPEAGSSDGIPQALRDGFMVLADTEIPLRPEPQTTLPVLPLEWTVSRHGSASLPQSDKDLIVRSYVSRGHAWNVFRVESPFEDRRPSSPSLSNRRHSTMTEMASMSRSATTLSKGYFVKNRSIESGWPRYRVR